MEKYQITDIRIFLGKTRAYIFSVSAKGLAWMKDNYDFLWGDDLSGKSTDIDLEHLDDTEQYMSREGLIVDVR